MIMEYSLFLVGCIGEPAPETSGDDESLVMDDTSITNPKETNDAAAVTPQVGGPLFATTDCGDDAWKCLDSSGISHAGIRNCKIVWFKDTSVSPTDFSQTVSYEFRDELTDGDCAHVTVNSGSPHNECNAVWIAETVKLTGHHSTIVVTLSHNGEDPKSRPRVAPTGF
jgi:uncharacterized protein (DUF1684 family)